MNYFKKEMEKKRLPLDTFVQGTKRLYADTMRRYHTADSSSVA